MGKPLQHTPRTVVPRYLPALAILVRLSFCFFLFQKGEEGEIGFPSWSSIGINPQGSSALLVQCGMEEVEDTPIFQERVTYLEGQSKAIKAEVKLLIGQAHAFAHAGVQYAEAGKAFAAKADELGAVMPALQSVGAGLKELFKLVEIMSQKQNELTQPLEQLCAQIKQV